MPLTPVTLDFIEANPPASRLVAQKKAEKDVAHHEMLRSRAQQYMGTGSSLDRERKAAWDELRRSAHRDDSGFLAKDVRACFGSYLQKFTLSDIPLLLGQDILVNFDSTDRRGHPFRAKLLTLEADPKFAGAFLVTYELYTEFMGTMDTEKGLGHVYPPTERKLNGEGFLTRDWFGCGRRRCSRPRIER